MRAGPIALLKNRDDDEKSDGRAELPNECSTDPTVPLRVAMVSPIGSIAGGERVLMEIARELQATGNSVRIFCLRPGSWTEGVWGRDIEIVAPNHAYRMRYPWTVARAGIWLRGKLRHYQPTIIHANHASWWIAAWASKGMSARSCWHLHDYPDKIDLATRFGIASPPDATLFTTARVASAFPKLTQQLHTIIEPSTVEPSEFSSAPQNTEVLKVHDLADKSFALTVGRWQPHKGLHFLPEIALALRERFGIGQDDLQFVVVGNPSNSDEEKYALTVKTRIKSLDLEACFRFVESCDDEQLRCLYAKSTMLLHPALSEGFGLVLLEAMALGTPVIAADASGPSQILKNGAGILVERGKVIQAAEAVHLVATDPNTRGRLIEAGLTRASELTRTQMVTRTIEFYRRMISHSNLHQRSL